MGAIPVEVQVVTGTGTGTDTDPGTGTGTGRTVIARRILPFSACETPRWKPNRSRTRNWWRS
jgi:hypothetical protein